MRRRARGQRRSVDVWFGQRACVGVRSALLHAHRRQVAFGSSSPLGFRAQSSGTSCQPCSHAKLRTSKPPNVALHHVLNVCVCVLILCVCVAAACEPADVGHAVLRLPAAVHRLLRRVRLLRLPQQGGTAPHGCVRAWCRGACPLWPGQTEEGRHAAETPARSRSFASPIL